MQAMKKLPAVLLLVLVAMVTGCAVVAPEKRHSPAEIAGYGPENFAAPIASSEGEQREVELARQKIRDALALAPGSDPAELVPEALGAVSFLNVEHEAGRSLLLGVLPDLAQRPVDYQRAVLSAAHNRYTTESTPVLMNLLDRLATPREFAIAAYTVLQADGSKARREALHAAMRTRFPDWQQEPRLVALDHALTVDVAAERRQRPPLVDLLGAPIRPGFPVVFSFQRNSRERFGLAVVRSPDGRFVRNADGSFFHIPHLAMATTRLPGTITNGNTPQGLFTIVGAGTATNRWIGPTPYLHSKVPIEASVAEFEHAEGAAVSEEWSEARYESFLPASWRGYFPFKEAWLAGRAGRDDMLLHGTTVNPDYYRGSSYYPGTPSAGCLVAMEYWSKQDGVMLRSDQLTLTKAFTAAGIDQGYLVVVEIDDRLDPVSLADVADDMRAAEGLARISAKAE
jgi:hypothetical protein